MYSTMTVPQLRKMACNKHVDLKENRTKEEIVEALLLDENESNGIKENSVEIDPMIKEDSQEPEIKENSVEIEPKIEEDTSKSDNMIIAYQEAYEDGVSYNELMEKIGMIIPSSLLESREKSEEYFVANLPYYNNVLSRPQRLKKPSSISSITFDEARDILCFYTDEEILNTFSLEKKTLDDWSSREDLLEKIIKQEQDLVSQ